MFHIFRGVVCLAMLLALAVPSLQATTAIQLSDQDLAGQADVVVIGKCVELRTAWIERALVTIATIRVSESLRGSTDTVTVVLPGGFDTSRKVPIAMSYAGAPQILVDEEVFLFLGSEREAGINGYSILGFSQGKFSIVTDTQGRKFVHRDMSRLNLQGAPATASGLRTRRPLSEFKAEMQRYLRNR